MNGEVIKQFLVGLGFQVDQGGLSKFQSGIGAGTLAVGALGTATIAAAGYITKMVTDVAEGFDKVSDLSGRVGASASSIMELGYVANLTDSSVEAVQSSMEGLSRTAGEAALGIGRGAMTFTKLGLSARDSNGQVKSTSALLEEVGQKIRGLSKAEQVATLGKLGIDPTMVQALTGSYGELRNEFNSVYQSLGVNLDDAAQSSSDFVDTTFRLRSVVDAIYKGVALRLMPGLKSGFDAMRVSLVANLPKIVNTLTPIMNTLVNVGAAFVQILTRVLQAASRVVDGLSWLDEATGGWSTMVIGLATAFKFLNAQMLMSPVGIVIGLAAAIALLVDDFMVWKEGGESLIDWSAWEPGINLAMAAFEGMKGMFVALVGIVSNLASAIAALFSGDTNAAMQSFGAVLEGVQAYFVSMFDMVTQLGSALSSLGGAAWDKLSGFFGGGGSTAPALAPSPQAAASVTGGTQSVSQQTTINVNGTSDPNATAKAVAGQQSRVHGDMARNLAGAVR
tara:strand:+ start:206 stop:1726 length:1521 start_codon:yes stop_codon:yes gene_type:complete